MKTIIISILFPFMLSCSTTDDLHKLFANYEKERQALNIPVYGMDYKANLGNIASLDKLEKYQIFYNQYEESLKKIDRSEFSQGDRINYDHLLYIIKLQQERFALEISFKKSEMKIPNAGISALIEHEKWYRLYTQIQTSTRMTPEDLYKFGEDEVKRVQEKIEDLKMKMGFENRDEALYAYLKSDKFYLTDTQEIVSLYRKKEAVIRKNLFRFFEDTLVPPLSISSWANATPMMPPGIYQIGQNRYDYNFSEKKHSTRAMDWIFNHEGIPGHHYQFSMMAKDTTTKPEFVNNTFYSGNIEGWACYTEYLGKELGQYQTREEELGKWEWDLIRSARVVLDVGIHYYGWNKEKALEFWKKNIKGQDEIAEREITRVTNWPAQALSYKVGAMKIEELKKKYYINESNIKRFHTVFLSFSAEPWDVIEMNFGTVFKSKS